MAIGEKRILQAKIKAYKKAKSLLIRGQGTRKARKALQRSILNAQERLDKLKTRRKYRASREKAR